MFTSFERVKLQSVKISLSLLFQ